MTGNTAGLLNCFGSSRKHVLFPKFAFLLPLFNTHTGAGGVMSFQHPFQAIQQLSPQEPGGRNVLVAAAGPEIYTFDVENGRQLSVWPESLEPQKSEPIDTSPGGEVDSEIQGPPEKKRKLSPSADDSKTVFNGKGSGGKKKSAKEWTIIPILTTSADGKHLIALTGEDKCIRVFDANKDGKLTQLSAR